MIHYVLAMVLAEACVSAEIHQVNELLERIVSQHLHGCHLLSVSSTSNSPVSFAVRSEVSTKLNMKTISGLNESGLLETLSRDTKTTCTGVIVHLDDIEKGNQQTMMGQKRENDTDDSITQILRLLEQVGVWKRPKARVVVVGEPKGVKAVLLHNSLRNTIHGLYLALHHRLAARTTWVRFSYKASLHELEIERVSVYRRCAYCQGGREGELLVAQEDIHRLPFLEVDRLFDDNQFQDMGGHVFRMVGLRHFPYMDYVTDNDAPGSTITLRDSLDARLITTLSATLNFTFELHEQREWEWGFPTDGQFNGMMGELQREEVDLCTVSAPVAERIGVVGFLKGYPSDRLIITSLKPTFLPENLALVRPFEVDVWAALVGSLVVWGSTLWLLGQVWRWFASNRAQGFSKAFLYVWGALLQQTPRLPSFSITEKVLMGLWLVFCLVMNTGYKSALISHLTVKSKSDTIETFKDLLKLTDWRWGAERWSLVGAPTRYLSLHTDPVVQHVYKGMEIYETIDETLMKVLAGGFSFISFKNYVTVAVASKFGGTVESSPFYVSKQGVSIMAVFGWHTRYGAPFQYRFSEILGRLQDVGITSRWQKEVIARRINENRAASKKNPSAEKSASQGVQQQQKGDARRVVLGLGHLQGAFYLMFLGACLACFALFVETVA